VNKNAQVRLSQTTLQTRVSGHDEVLDALSDLMNRIERGLHAKLISCRKWTGDLAVSYYQQFGISAKLMESCYAARQAKIASVVELEKLHVAELGDEIAAKRRQIAKKQANLKASRKKVAVAAADLAKAEAKLARLGIVLDGAGPAERPRALQQYKSLLGVVQFERGVLTKLIVQNRRTRADLHQHKRRVEGLSSKLDKAKQRVGKPSLAFGSKKLFKAQFHLKQNGFASHAEWREAWRKARSSTFMIEGDKACEGGSRFARLQPREDGCFDLELRLPEALASFAGETKKVSGNTIHVVRLKGLHFAHRSDELRDALSRNIPIAIRFHRDDEGWRIMPCFKALVAEVRDDYGSGAIGVDLNAGFALLTRADRFGNVVETFDVPLVTYGKSIGQSRDACRQAVATIVAYAGSHDLPIVCEKLDFSDKKKRLSQDRADPRRARQLSSFAYSAFAAALDSACARKGVHLRRVNPAYTSIIGRTKFASRYGLSVHAAASLAIARRAMGLSEQLPPSSIDTRSLRIPMDDSRHVTVELPARNEPGKQDAGSTHVWSEWAKVLKAFRGVHAARRPSRRKHPPRSTLGRGELRSMVGRSGRTVSGSSPQSRNRRGGSDAATA
jgi:IS605 OrfB family transposase